jgi:hypothetical protein
MLKKSMLLTLFIVLCFGVLAVTAQAKDLARTQDQVKDVLKTCTQFVDLNGDGICDNCGSLDLNGDGICDFYPCVDQTRTGR